MPASTVLSALAAMMLVASVQGHSYLALPAARNAIKNAEGGENCPHCLQAGGPATVSSRANGSWPSNAFPESHGLCGDPVQGSAVEADWKNEKYLNPTPVQASYIAGDIAEFVIAISTHHMGHYEFRICDRTMSGETLSTRKEGQDCLNEHVLERAEPSETCVPDDANPDCQPIDPKHPGRWYLPPVGYGSYGNPDDTEANFPYGVSEVHVMRYRIPWELNCSKCTLQWYWSTGNACLYDGDYITYFKAMQKSGWTTASEWCPWCTTTWATCENSCCGRQRGFGEEFWNCADIAVYQNGSAPEIDNDTDTDAPYTDGGALTTTAVAGTTAATGPCSAVWGQCGGLNWNGAMCCESGNHCVYSNDWYSQCVPATTPAGPSSATTSTSSGNSVTAAPVTTLAGECSSVWEQCGGVNWNGPICCVSGNDCVLSNEWYSQCRPATTAAVTTRTVTTTAAAATTTTTTIITTTRAGSTTTTASATTSSCGSLCHRLNNTFDVTGCKQWADDKEKCVDSFISHGDAVVPCKWVTCGTGGQCIADGAELLQCAEEILECGCASTGSWGSIKCRNLCHAHPTSCSSDCASNCGTGCECNSARRLSSPALIV